MDSLEIQEKVLDWTKNEILRFPTAFLCIFYQYESP